MSARSKARSIFAKQMAAKRAEARSSVHAALNEEAVFMVNQCINGQRDGIYECVSLDFIEDLRDAAFSLGVDYEQMVAPYFHTLAEYERCIYTWYGASGEWVTLLFNKYHKALLTIVGAPRIDKLVGSFAYNMSAERKVLCISDVGPYAEILVQPVAGSSDVLLVVPERKLELLLTNQTPQRLCTAPALPSYFTKE